MGLSPILVEEIFAIIRGNISAGTTVLLASLPPHAGDLKR